MTIEITITALVLLIAVRPIWYDKQTRRNWGLNNEHSGGGSSGSVFHPGQMSHDCDPGGGLDGAGGFEGGSGGGD